MRGRINMLSGVSNLFSKGYCGLSDLAIKAARSPAISEVAVTAIDSSRAFRRVGGRLGHVVRMVGMVSFASMFMEVGRVLCMGILGYAPRSGIRVFRVTRAFGTGMVSCKGSDLLIRFMRATAGGSTIIGLVGRRFGDVRIIQNKDIKVRSVDVVRE